METCELSVQFYSGSHLDETFTGRQGDVFQGRGASSGGAAFSRPPNPAKVLTRFFVWENRST